MWNLIDFESAMALAEILTALFFNSAYRFLFVWNHVIEFQYEFSKPDIEAANALSRGLFPDRFLVGVATWAYHFGENESRSTTGWMTEENCCNARDDTNGEITCDSYANYKEDIASARNRGAAMYRVTLCWSWLVPDGFAGPINEEAVLHYEDVFDEILKNGMTPVGTLMRRDLPYTLRQLGGWTNPRMIDWFESYANLVFNTLGDRAKLWITLDDPVSLCTIDYGGTSAPTRNLSGIADYICGYHVLLAQARVYNLYKSKFYSKQRGRLGVAQNFTWFEPWNETNIDDVSGANAAFQWYNGWFANPLFGRTGDYPRMMKDRVVFKSRVRGCEISRLPLLSDEEMRDVRFSADFLGINFYGNSAKVRGLQLARYDRVGFDEDAGIEILENRKGTPSDLGKLVRRLRDDYALPEIYITGGDYGDTAEDTAVYYRELLTAMQDGLDIRGYMCSSILNR